MISVNTDSDFFCLPPLDGNSHLLLNILSRDGSCGYYWHVDAAHLLPLMTVCSFYSDTPYVTMGRTDIIKSYVLRPPRASC